MAEIQSSSTGLSGEYFVAAELLRRGYSVGITMGNAKAIDILAEKDGKQFIIQVKAIFKKKNVGWPMMADKIIENIFYGFVTLNGDKMTEPEYFIATGFVTPSFPTFNAVNRYATPQKITAYKN